MAERKGNLPAAESVIEQLNKKLKLAEGYPTKETAYNHLKLWTLCYLSAKD